MWTDDDIQAMKERSQREAEQREKELDRIKARYYGEKRSANQIANQRAAAKNRAAKRRRNKRSR